MRPTHKPRVGRSMDGPASPCSRFLGRATAPGFGLSVSSPSTAFIRCFAQLIRDSKELLSTLLEPMRHAGEILRSRRPSADCPTAKHIVLQVGIIGELPHGERPVAEHALNKPNDVFALHGPLRLRICAHKFVLTARRLDTIL